MSDFFFCIVVIGFVLLLMLAAVTNSPKHRVIRTGDTYTVQDLQGCVYGNNFATTNHDEALKVFNERVHQNSFEIVTNSFPQ